MNLTFFVLLFLVFNANCFSLLKNAENFFDILDQNSDDLLSWREIAEYHDIVHPNSKNLIQNAVRERENMEKLFRKPFDLFVGKRDRDGDGLVSREEFLEYLRRDFERFPGMKRAEEDRVSELQLHLSWTMTPQSSMRLTWVTFPGYEEATVPTIRYRETGTQNEYRYVLCATTTYNQGIFGWFGRIHNGVMGDLKSGTMYSYSVSVDNTTFIEESTFVTQRAQSEVDPGLITRYAFYADQGSYIPQGYEVAAVVCEQVSNRKLNYRAVIHAGDLAYATSVVGTHKEISYFWDMWSEVNACSASNVAYMVSVGNHENPYDFDSFRHRLLMPYPYPRYNNDSFWYSVKDEHVFWLFVDTQHTTSGPIPPQLEYLENELKRAVSDRHEQPWILVVGHRPHINSGTDEWDQHNPTSPLFKSMKPLFDKYGVDMYLSGHQHMYESAHPIWENGTVAQYPNKNNQYVSPPTAINICQGTGGIFMFDTTFREPAPEWSSKRNLCFSYGRMTINATHLHYEQVCTDNEILDDF